MYVRVEPLSVVGGFLGGAMALVTGAVLFWHRWSKNA